MTASRIEVRGGVDAPERPSGGHLEVRIDSPTSWTLFGELDVASAWTLRSIADSAPPVGYLELWLHRLTFMDAAGWRAMRDVHDRFAGDLVLVSPTPQVERLLAETGLP